MTNESPAEMYSKHLYGSKERYKANNGSRDEQVAYLMWARQLTSLAVNRFKWINMPKTIDVRFLEMTLFHQALAVFYYNEKLGAYLAVQGVGTGYANFIQNPVSFNIIAPGMNFAGDPTQQIQSPAFLSAFNPATDYEKIGKDAKKCGFPIWANYLRIPDIDMIEIYARRLAMVDRTIEINTVNARQPKVLKASQGDQLTLTNISRQQDNGSNIIVVNGSSVDMDSIDVLDLGIDVKQLTELSLLKARMWNEVMGLLGIDNSNQDKKERLVASEVDANNGQTDSFRFIQLNARKQACEWINDTFPDLDIDVEYNVEVEAMAKQVAMANQIQEPTGKEENPNG
jgi:hypothetical protein